MTLNAKIGGLWIFWRFRAATQVCIIYKEAPRYYHYVQFGTTLIKLYSIPNSHKSNSDRFSLYDFVVL